MIDDNKIRLLFFFLISLIGCEEKIDLELEGSSEVDLVVDGILTSLESYQKVVLSKPYKEISEEALPVSDANIIVLSNTELYHFKESDEERGSYISTNEFRVRYGVKYTIKIECEGREYTASSEVVPITPFNEIIIVENQNSKNRFMIDENSFESEEDAFFEVTYEWGIDDGFEGAGLNRAKSYYYSISSMEVSEVFSPDKETIVFPIGTKISIQKYAVNEIHAEYLRSFLIETQWSGGMFDEAAANVGTNLTDGAIGFFGTCIVLKKEFVFE